MLAYLVIREGSKWTDVFKLIPGRTVTIGRAVTNQIVVKDERSSRYHAEIFHTQGVWTLRDLDSRNGTLVGSEKIRGDYPLKVGDVVRIAHCQLAFVHDVSKAFTEGHSPSSVQRSMGDETVTNAPALRMSDASLSDSDVMEPSSPSDSPPVITHRRGQTRYLDPKREDDVASPKLGRAAAKLCRLAFELANQPNPRSLAQAALQGLIESIQVDAGAVLLLPRGLKGTATGLDLELVAARSEIKPSYHRLSRFLADIVLRDGEAVLARNVEDDSILGSSDSKGVIHSTGVICAPIRQDNKVVGLIHLYSTVSEKIPDPDDLEFTLAVAENVAAALRNFAKQEELAENLEQTQTEVVQLRKRLGVESELVGTSGLLGQIHQDISRAAPSRATVLVRGESGTGKELVARAIHYSSPRKNGPFVCLNCAALSETLLESELFGHERGAFTGATERKIGKFEAAHQGTLMLDEIGEMSSAVQSKFLRVLEGHPFERVGGNQAIKVDVRVIAATNRDLEQAVTSGDFRRDLFFRLRVVEISVPPLRKRADDVVELALYFLDRFNQETGRKIRGFTAEALERMRRYRWPGNVRELKNVVERAVVLCPNEIIDASDLMMTTLATVGDSGEISLPMLAAPVYEPLTLEQIECRHIQQTLSSTGWNKSRTATILGIERSTLDRKIKAYGLTNKGMEPGIG